MKVTSSVIAKTHYGEAADLLATRQTILTCCQQVRFVVVMELGNDTTQQTQRTSARANLLPTCYGETGVMDFRLKSLCIGTHVCWSCYVFMYVSVCLSVCVSVCVCICLCVYALVTLQRATSERRQYTTISDDPVTS